MLFFSAYLYCFVVVIHAILTSNPCNFPNLSFQVGIRDPVMQGSTALFAQLEGLKRWATKLRCFMGVGDLIPNVNPKIAARPALQASLRYLGAGF